ncbi:MAG: DUF4153 domain-containing protein [Balneolaceae bacterium]
MKFSIPSLSQILDTGLKTYYRFPFVILVAIIGTVAGIWSVSVSSPETEAFPLLIKILAISALGVSLLFGIDTLSEELSIDLPKKYGLRIFGLILLVLYFVLVGDGFENGPGKIWIQYLLFALATHLFASFAPFLVDGKVDEFWEFNKSLFLRILTSALYTLVLYVGLVIAMLAIDNLLEFNIDGDRYLQLFIFLVGIFNTWFFLAGVPELGRSSENKAAYPKALKVFVQYVLIPLVTVYISILYLYTIKILLQWEMPNGWVSYLVLSFSIVGIFSLLLLYPIRNHEDSKWIKIYSKGYYFALIPLVILLLVSIYIRISEYGVTINRYFVATLGVWLAGLVVYYLVSKKKSIKVIPISLCLVVLGVSFGPLGAFSVSERSQLGRFEDILSNNGLIDENDHVLTASNPITFEDRKELSSIVLYLVDHHGLEVLSSYFSFDLEEEVENFDPEMHGYIGNFTSGKVTKLMGFDFVYDWSNEDTDEKNRFNLVSQNVAVTSVSGYQYYIPDISFSRNDSIEAELLTYEPFKLSYSFDEDTLAINHLESGKNIKFIIIGLVHELYEKYPDWNYSDEAISAQEARAEVENEDLKIVYKLKRAEGKFENELSLESFSVDLLIHIKE